MIGDLDYLTICGSDKSKSLFASDREKQWQALAKDKKSTDRRSLLNQLRKSAESGDTSQLTKFLDYFESRLVKIKTELSAPEIKSFEDDIRDLRGIEVYVLRYGEIEDYLLEGVSTVEDIVALTEDDDWLIRLDSDEKIADLHKIVSSILQITDASATELLEMLIGRKRPVFTSSSNCQ